MFRFGIDLGGTKIEGVVLNAQGEIMFRDRVPTEQDNGYDHILGNVRNLYERMVQEIDGQEHTFGIGTPGAVSPRTGLLKNANTQCLNNRTVKKDLEALLRRPIEIQNDANCFAMAEALLGAGKDYPVAFGVIMGTGCGGGIVVDGKIITGPQAIAGEWGHMTIDPNGPACWCGSHGCVERYISGSGLEQRYETLHGEKLSAEDIVSAFRASDSKATQTIMEFFDAFGRAMANLINILDPDVIVLGGGLSNVDELYSQGTSHVKRYVFSDGFDTPIVKNQMGDSAGVIGAALIGV